VNGTVELAGPERYISTNSSGRFLSANPDARQVVADVHARDFGAELNDQSLTPGDNPRIAPTRVEDWHSRSRPQRSVKQDRGPDRVVRRSDDELPVTLPTRSRGLRLQIRDPVDRPEALGSPHVHARHVSPLKPVMPLMWRIVETNDNELPVVREGTCSKRGRMATHALVEGHNA